MIEFLCKFAKTSQSEARIHSRDHGRIQRNGKIKCQSIDGLIWKDRIDGYTYMGSHFPSNPRLQSCYTFFEFLQLQNWFKQTFEIFPETLIMFIRIFKHIF